MKRKLNGAALLGDTVLPREPMRQWVLLADGRDLLNRPIDRK